MKPSTLLKTVVIGAALSAGSLFANTVQLYQDAYTGGLGGGEFVADFKDSSNNVIATTLTFCIEEHVGVNNGGTYAYTIDNNALLQDDPISAGTAWLYTQFILGTLPDASGSGSYFGANRYADAGLLQEAIWMLEDEIPVGPNAYLAMAEAANGGTFATAHADEAANGRVKALNLWGPNGEDIQSQLIYVPDTGMTAALLGFGLISLVAFRRKSK